MFKIPESIHQIATRITGQDLDLQGGARLKSRAADHTTTADNAKIPDMRAAASQILNHRDIQQVPDEYVSKLEYAVKSTREREKDANREILFNAIKAIASLEVEEKEPSDHQKEFLQTLDEQGIKYEIIYPFSTEPMLQVLDIKDFGSVLGGSHLTNLCQNPELALNRIKLALACKNDDIDEITLQANNLCENFIQDLDINHLEALIKHTAIMKSLNQKNIDKFLKALISFPRTTLIPQILVRFAEAVTDEKNIYEMLHDYADRNKGTRKTLIDKFFSHGKSVATQRVVEANFINFIELGAQYEKEIQTKAGQQVFTKIKNDLIAYSESADGYRNYQYGTSFQKAARKLKTNH